jgi:transposase-like protein
MTKRRFRCRHCGNKFEVEVFEPGEAARKNLPVDRVTCPECGSADLEWL